jgi:phage terminase large subunit
MEIKSYVPFPKQRLFHTAKQQFKAFIGAFGSGKSVAGVWEAIDLSMRYDNNFGLICRKYNDDLKETTMRTFFEECPPELISDTLEGGSKIIFKNGSTIKFSGLYTKAKTRISKIGSMNLGWFFIDEAHESTEEDFGMLKGRLRLKAAKKHYGFLATNPPNSDHWLAKTFAVINDTYFRIHSTSYDNPTLPEDYIKNLEAMPEAWRRKYLFGEFGFLQYGYPVYSNFNEKIHLKELQYNSALPVIRSWDFGWWHPAVLFIQVDENMISYFLEEIMGEKIYLEDFANKIIFHSNKNYPNAHFIDYGDPAGNQRNDKSKLTSIQILAEKGIRVRSRRSLISRGINLMEQRLSMNIAGQPAIQIDSSKCRIFAEGLAGGYHYSKNQEGIPDVEPNKDGYYEHLADCGRYYIENTFGHNIQDSHSGIIKVREPKWSSGQQLHH